MNVMSAPDKIVPQQPHARLVRSVDLRSVAGGRIQLIGVDMPPTTPPAKTIGVVEFPTPTNMNGSLADAIADRVVQRLTAAATASLANVTSTNDTMRTLAPVPVIKESVNTAARGRVASSKRFPESSTEGDVVAPANMTATSLLTGHACDELLTVGDVARVLAVRRSKAYEIWARLPKVRLGPRCVRVRREALEDFFRDQERRPRWR